MIDDTWSNILTIHHSDREVGRGSGHLAGLMEQSLGWVGVEERSNGLTIDHGGGEVSGGLRWEH